MRTMLAFAFVVGVAACGGGGSDPDAHVTSPDARTGCEPATALPTQFRPIAEVSAGVMSVTTTDGVTSGTIDATAGGMGAAADNPYIYIDLVGKTKVEIDDIAAISNPTWDIALKRSSLRSNGGDSGPGGRSVTSVPAAELAAVLPPAPTTGYVSDDFATDDCMYIGIPGGEPMSGFGEWYDYDDATHIVTPKVEAYVIARPDGSHTAFRVADYYGDVSMPMRGAFFQVEWKDL